jgi:hypothetical protein
MQAPIPGKLRHQGFLSAQVLCLLMNRCTPDHVLHLLLEVLRYNDNDYNAYDDAHWRAAFVEALGNTQPSNVLELKKVS